MTVRKLLVITFYLLGCKSFAQSEDKQAILIWSEDYVIAWDDFCFKDSSFKSHKAISSTNIKVKGFWDNSLPNFRVFAIFDREKSWTVDTTSMNLLKHEILHFDITELYARKIRKAIAELREKGEKNIEVYSKIIKKLLLQYEERQELYDQETSHGVYKGIQEEWTMEINKELELSL